MTYRFHVIDVGQPLHVIDCAHIRHAQLPINAIECAECFHEIIQLWESSFLTFSINFWHDISYYWQLCIEYISTSTPWLYKKVLSSLIRNDITCLHDAMLGKVSTRLNGSTTTMPLRRAEL